jgi:hypothetical protein
MIYNRSAHPVEIKKISVRLWSLRDEIEAAIFRRMKECEAAGVPLYIDDIKRFYNLDLDSPLTAQGNVLPFKDASKESGLNSLMESIADEANSEPVVEAVALAEEVPALQAETPVVEGEIATPPADSKTFKEAEEIIAEQTMQGLENKKPNPILERPYQRQAPDLDKLSYGFTFLSDMNMDSILIFTKDKFLQGQSVVMEFLIPQNFIMTANITYCHNYAMRSRIISSTKPDYRVQCKFSFSIRGERDTLRTFLKSIEPTFVAKKEKKKEVKPEDDLGI